MKEEAAGKTAQWSATVKQTVRARCIKGTWDSFSAGLIRHSDTEMTVMK